MTKLDEKKALAIVLANTRRKPESRKVDILTIAKSLDFLLKYYKSKETLLQKVDLSWEMVRQFLTALKLPEEVQKLIKERKIDSVDAVRNLAAMPKEQQLEVAFSYMSANLKYSDDRRDVKRLIKSGDFSLDDAIKILEDAKPKGIHLFIMDFDNSTYEKLKNESQKRKIKPADLVKNLVNKWLEELGHIHENNK